jgi:hypothetical protein
MDMSCILGRRAFFGLLFLCSLVWLSYAAPRPDQTQHRVLVGTAVDRNFLKQPDYAETVKKYFKLITAQNGKPSTQPQLFFSKEFPGECCGLMCIIL